MALYGYTPPPPLPTPLPPPTSIQTPVSAAQVVVPPIPNITCSDFRNAALPSTQYCSNLATYLGMPALMGLCETPEPRAAWTDLVMASINLEKAIDISFAVKTGLTKMKDTKLQSTMSGFLTNAYYSIYYAWMYLCQASKSDANLSGLINNFNIALTAIQNLIAKLNTIKTTGTSSKSSTSITDLSNFANIYIYAFEGVISSLSKGLSSTFNLAY